MITIFQALVIGALQGLTELFPISSLGHSVILPQLFGWHIQQSDQNFLIFLVATHAATAVVLVGFFWRDWIEIIQGLWRIAKTRRVDPHDTYAKLALLLVVGTVPAGIIGVVLDKSITNLLGSAEIAALFLVVNGIVLLTAERLRKRARLNSLLSRSDSDRRIARLSIKEAIGVGTAQAAALIPGISRSGSSMAGGLLVGLNNEDAARFSFLLATPVIGGAALLKLPHAFSHQAATMRGALIVGAISAAITAYISVRFLVKYFETKRLTPFGWYCIVAGVGYAILLAVH